jgi:hypothetical protein
MCFIMPLRLRLRLRLRLGVCVLCSVMCLLSIVSCYALIVDCRLSIVDGFRTVDSRGYLQPRLGSGQGGLSP